MVSASSPAQHPLLTPPFLSFSPRASTGLGIPGPAGCRMAGDIKDPSRVKLVWAEGIERGEVVCASVGLPAPGARPARCPSRASLVVTTDLTTPAGLVAQWSEEDQKNQQMISIPLETYAQGCVKDVEEGLEVKLSPRASGSLLSNTVSLWSPLGVPVHVASLCPSEWMQLGAILLRGVWGWNRVDCWEVMGCDPKHLTHLRWPRGSATH